MKFGGNAHFVTEEKFKSLQEEKENERLNAERTIDLLKEQHTNLAGLNQRNEATISDMKRRQLCLARS